MASSPVRGAFRWCPFKLYKVDDGTGEVTVVAQDGRVPTKGVARQRQGARQRVRQLRRTVGRPAPPAEKTQVQDALTECPVNL